MLQLIYRIQKKEPNTLQVLLEEKGTKRLLYLDQLKALPSGPDREALAFLIPIHLRSPNVSRSADTATFQRIDVPASHAHQAIQLLAKTGRLFFQGAALSYNPIALPIRWEGKLHSERACTVNAYVAGAALKQLDLLFPAEPYLAICQGVCQPLATAAPWIWLERFLQGEQLLEGSAKKKFLEEDLPIQWARQEEKKPLEVFPELVLQDPTGSFAHLWMDYGLLGRVAFEDLCPTIQGNTRLKEAEALWEKDLIEAGFIRKAVGATQYFCPGDRVASTLQFLLELGWRVIDSKNRRVLRQTGIDLKLREEETYFTARARVQFSDRSAPLPRASRLWVELDGNTVGLIDHKALQPVLDLFQEGILQGDLLALPRQKISLLAPWLDAAGVDWAESLKEKVAKISSGIEPSPPDSSFQGALFPYQQEGVDWLSHLHKWGFSGLLADEMGLGKTVQVLAFFSRLGTNLPLLIVAPTSLLINWSRECSRFLPRHTPYIHSGPDRCQDPSLLKTYPLIITSYAILRLDETLFKQLFFEVIVLDESQAIKNQGTQTAQAALQLRSNTRFCLSGTPIENRIEEFVSQYQFLLPNLLSSKDSPELLKRKSRPFFLRRCKADVDLQLPEKRNQILWIEMTDEQHSLYLSYQAQSRKKLSSKITQDGATPHRLEILEAILRLRQICCDPRLLGAPAPGAKSLQLLADLDTLLSERHKVLIYSQFTSLLSLLKQDLAAYSPLYIDGSTDYEERARQVYQFQNDPSSRLFLLSLKAGGTGLNLTAADTVVLFDPWWNDAVEEQAIDRVHRIGQIQKTLAKRYLTPNSIEEKILHLKQRKLSLSTHLLSSTEESLTAWSAEDLLHLLF